MDLGSRARVCESFTCTISTLWLLDPESLTIRIGTERSISIVTDLTDTRFTQSLSTTDAVGIMEGGISYDDFFFKTGQQSATTARAPRPLLCLAFPSLV